MDTYLGKFLPPVGYVYEKAEFEPDYPWVIIHPVKLSVQLNRQ
jgi:hypothetical protein